jgi:hypothetical protein
LDSIGGALLAGGAGAGAALGGEEAALDGMRARAVGTATTERGARARGGGAGGGSRTVGTSGIGGSAGAATTMFVVVVASGGATAAGARAD